MKAYEREEEEEIDILDKNEVNVPDYGNEIVKNVVDMNDDLITEHEEDPGSESEENDNND